MSKTQVPLVIEDLSGFARALGRALEEHDGPPGHLSLMNMLARAGGFRNFQHLRAANASRTRLAEQPVAEPVDHKLVERTVNLFDPEGRLTIWPSRRAVQDLSLWAFWARLPAERRLPEKDVNAVLNAAHLFGDAAILRRTMVTLGMVTREKDGSDYLRVEQRPPAEARALLDLLAERRRKASS